MEHFQVIFLHYLLLLPFIDGFLMNWDEHVDQRLILELFVNHTIFLLRLLFNCSGKGFSDLWRIEVGVVPIVENLIISEGIPQIGQFRHVTVSEV